jgi:hypothetical protein
VSEADDMILKDRLCCATRLTRFSFPRTASCHALREGRAEGDEAVEHRDADVKLGDLARRGFGGGSRSIVAR